MGCSSGRSTSTVDDAYCGGVIQLEMQIKAFDVLVNKLQDETITNTVELESNGVKQQIDTLQVDINETILKTKDEIAALPDNNDDNNSTNNIKRLNEEKFTSLTMQYENQSQTISEILKSKLSEHLYI
jgi:hypothetical protein